MYIQTPSQYLYLWSYPMWLKAEKISKTSIVKYQESLLHACPRHIVIDGLFDDGKLDEVMLALRHAGQWQTQKHSYSTLYVDNDQWENTPEDQRFVQRDIWQRDADSFGAPNPNIAQEFLDFLRSDEFLLQLSQIFDLALTDMNVADPNINTNYFRLGAEDFVEQHADDSPGREVCMLLYLNKDWNSNAGGELSFLGNEAEPIKIAPLFNRCVLFDPSSEGSEHWVEQLNSDYSGQYRYNVTSWYWRE